MRHLRRLAQWPLLLVARHPRVRDAVDRDIRRALQPRLDLDLRPYTTGEALAICARRPFRSILYTRLRLASTPLRLVAAGLRLAYPGESGLEIHCTDIGPGLLMMHGTASIILAERIGTDCQLSQHVTVGYSDHGGPPVLGDRVRIGTNAVVAGPLTLADDSVVGAGAVVVRDVPAGKVVGGVPARVLEDATDRFSALRRGRDGNALEGDPPVRGEIPREGFTNVGSRP